MNNYWLGISCCHSKLNSSYFLVILKEGKLDLSTEEEVKKLLEGPRLQEGEKVDVDAEDGKYSSKFVSVSNICVAYFPFLVATEV